MSTSAKIFSQDKSKAAKTASAFASTESPGIAGLQGFLEPVTFVDQAIFKPLAAGISAALQKRAQKAHARRQMSEQHKRSRRIVDDSSVIAEARARKAENGRRSLEEENRSLRAEVAKLRDEHANAVTNQPEADRPASHLSAPSTPDLNA